MIQLPSRRFLVSTAVFLLSVGILLFMRLLPLKNGITGWPGPDITLALILAWILRRPDQISAPVIVMVILIEDMLLMRPLGLWTAIVLMGSEAARLREHRWRDQPFMVEWLRVTMLIGLMMLGYRFVQILFMVPVPALGQVILQYLATVLAYPLVIFAARWLIGLRRTGHGEGT